MTSSVPRSKPIEHVSDFSEAVVKIRGRAILTFLGVVCLVLIGLPREARAQEPEPLQPGEAYVTRFSGTSTADGKPVIDLKGTVGSIVDVRNPSQPPQGQHWLNEPQRHKINAEEAGQVFGVAR